MYVLGALLVVFFFYFAYELAKVAVKEICEGDIGWMGTSVIFSLAAAFIFCVGLGIAQGLYHEFKTIDVIQTLTVVDSNAALVEVERETYNDGFNRRTELVTIWRTCVLCEEYPGQTFFFDDKYDWKAGDSFKVKLRIRDGNIVDYSL